MARVLLSVAVCLAVLAVLAVHGAPSRLQRGVNPRADLTLGVLGPDDQLRMNFGVKADGVANEVKRMDVPVRAASISFVQALEVGESQNASCIVVDGGLGNNTITLGFISQIGGGFDYAVVVYGSPPTPTTTEAPATEVIQN